MKKDNPHKLIGFVGDIKEEIMKDSKRRNPKGQDNIKEGELLPSQDPANIQPRRK